MAILVFLTQFGGFYLHLVNFVVIWQILSHFDMFQRGKSGNPVAQVEACHKI
jgi:hypothetical protein